ncbi:MAG: ABC transporter ATP-binding protein [Candidatus Methylomirabilales bacterium]
MGAPAARADTPPSGNAERVLEVRDLRVHFSTDFGTVEAVGGISYTLGPGETLAIVGESGSGKSVGALAILGLVPPPGKVVSGAILFQGRDLLRLEEGQLRKIRGNRIGMIFQDPLTSLNPVLPVGRQIAEAVRVHEGSTRREARKRSAELMQIVGIPNARERMDDYPHQFSGGMRQRVMIAMAIAMSPAVLIADEPTTALDVTIQAQILGLLKSLQRDLGMALILITHDLGVVAEQADRVAVMYAGRFVECASVEEIYYGPLHPYAIGLMGSIARLDRERAGRLEPIRGQPPSLILIPQGCPFHPRCDFMRDVCSEREPELAPYQGTPHMAACHFTGDLPQPRRPEA